MSTLPRHARHVTLRQSVRTIGLALLALAALAGYAAAVMAHAPVW